MIVHWRAFDSYRWLLVAWKICYRRLVESCSSVDVDGIDDVVGGF